MDKVDVTFFVPCFNEEDNVVPTVEMIVKAMAGRSFPYEVLVFDDGSTDDSVSRIEAYQNKNPRVPLRLEKSRSNRGLGANYVRGALQARGEHFMMVCGDNDTPVETLSFMLDQMGKADMVIPYLSNLDERPFGRRVFSKAYTWLVGNISGTHLRYYNGIVLHKTKTVLRFQPWTTGFGYQAEILSRAVADGVSFIEVPIRTVPQSGMFNTAAFRLKNVFWVSVGLVLLTGHRLIRAWRGLVVKGPPGSAS